MPTFIKPGFWRKAAKSFEGWLNLDELIASHGGGGGSTAPVDVTYAELVAKINAGTLVPETTYRLTDYYTVHYILNYNGNQLAGNPINTGALEHLLLKASTTDTFYPEVYSEEYPQDILYYDWNPTNWLNDAAFCLDGSTIVSNFKGVIFTRNDTLKKNVMGEDFRNTRNRRWKRNDPIWDSGTTYAIKTIVQVPGATGGVYFSKVNGNLNNLVTNTTKWEKIIDYSLTEYWCCISPNSLDINDFIDVHTFHPLGIDTYEIAVQNNYFEPFRDNLDYFNGYTSSILSNNVFYLGNDNQYSIYNNQIGGFFNCNTINYNFYDNVIGDYFISNIINCSFASNTIGTDFISNIIGFAFSANNISNYFTYNIIGDLFSDNLINDSFLNNTIGNNFTYNTTGGSFTSNICDSNFLFNTIDKEFTGNTVGYYFEANVIGNYFTTNTIGNGFGYNTISNSFYHNTIGNNFIYNTIGNGFDTNNISDDFNTNTIGNYFHNSTITASGNFNFNTVMDNFNGTGIDFSSSIHIYATYNCTLFKTSTGTYKLSYVDGATNLMVITDANS